MAHNISYLHFFAFLSAWICSPFADYPPNERPTVSEFDVNIKSIAPDIKIVRQDSSEILYEFKDGIFLKINIKGDRVVALNAMLQNYKNEAQVEVMNRLASIWPKSSDKEKKRPEFKIQNLIDDTAEARRKK